MMRKVFPVMNNTSHFFKHAVLSTFGAAMVSIALAQAPSDKPTVSGTFLGNGKDGNIKHLVVTAREAFNDKAAIRLTFCEKDPSKSKNPDMDATFNRLGSALSISVTSDGTIFGCMVSHAAHEKSGFNDLGKIKTEDFKVTETHVSGRITTGGELEAFGQKWAADLTFSAPLPPGAFAVTAPDKTPEKTAGSKPMDAKKPATAAESAPATTGPKPAVAQLPLPAGARDVEYKAIVQQISFSADASVSVLTKDFASKLAAAGWKEAPGSLTGKSNAILKRTLNGAELTAMVQPAGKGCTVKLFTQGIDWSNPPASAPAASPAKIDTDAIEAEANRRLQDALKGLK
jgi:hypothetical protein